MLNHSESANVKITPKYIVLSSVLLRYHPRNWLFFALGRSRKVPHPVVSVAVTTKAVQIELTKRFFTSAGLKMNKMSVDSRVVSIESC